MQALKDIFSDQTFSVVRRQLDLMKLAEEAIERAIKKRPRLRKKLNKQFLLLQPSRVLNESHHYVDCVYEHHCDELLERAATGQDTRLGTKAECLLALSNMSLIRPPKSNVAWLQEKLMLEIFPDKWKDAPQFREDYQGAGDELFSSLAKKIFTATRVAVAL
jgi:hypothetical protein